jgi:hypothetical protein
MGGNWRRFELGAWGHSLGVFWGFALFYAIVFAPGWWGDQVLAFDDGILYFLPAYQAPPTLSAVIPSPPTRRI